MLILSFIKSMKGLSKRRFFDCFLCILTSLFQQRLSDLQIWEKCYFFIIFSTDFFIGVEVINKFTITEPFTNNGVFYTDSNGREMMKRTLNLRSDYEYNSTVEPVASNYYPVTSKITIKDESKNIRVTVLNDRSQGGSSLSEGTIELMVRLFVQSNYI